VFIVLEGIDGCGKSTQAKLLGAWLSQQGKEVLLTAEPTRTRVGKLIREILSGGEQVDPKTLALLFTADRAQHLATEVEPAIAEGKVVVCERYVHSTVAYQEAQGVSRRWLIELNRFAPEADVTFLLDVEPGLGASRTSTGEIFENGEFLEKVRDNYLKFDRGIAKLDGSRSVGEVFCEMKDRLREFL